MAEGYSYVFVYGTLKRGFTNHYNLLGNAMRFECNGVTADNFVLYMDHENRQRPCMIRVSNLGYQIRGEIYSIPNSSIPDLDEFERTPTHYTRELITVTSDHESNPIQAFVYINVTNESRRDAIIKGHFSLLSEYTLEHNKFYTPRAQLKQQPEQSTDDESSTAQNAPVVTRNRSQAA